MLLSKIIGKRLKEAPKDSQSISNNFLIRGAYIKPVSSGIYSLLPLAKKVIKKIEEIIRQEMNKIDGQEVLMPVALPADLWKQSGRYESVDESLLKFKDRNEKDMVLAMTHEEVVCDIVKTEVSSYKQLPFMLYHIQTKYRDEARPRAGLIRVREFTMKDAYSFHLNQECLEEYYHKVLKSYQKIFERIGIKDFLIIKSDSGMMGGNVAHEFMAISEIGEDTIFASPNRNYLANKEIATSNIKFIKEQVQELKKISTPKKTTIEEISDFLKLPKEKTGKAVFFEDDEGKKLIFAMIRGDIELNETKLKNALQINNLTPASEKKIKAIGACPGYASPIGIKMDSVILVIDPSIKESNNLVVGANEEGRHYLNFNYDRDCANQGQIIDIATVKAGDSCPLTGEKLEELKGIEIANVFQLGTKYSDIMKCRYLNEYGKEDIPIMGCYGIGLGRSMAAVIEQSHDDYGPIWPMSIAPFQLHIIPLNYNKGNIKNIADKLYNTFLNKGIETILDDRNVKAGFAFNDADLLGSPYKLIISPKLLEQGKVEFASRDKTLKEFIALEQVQEKVAKIIFGKLKENS